MTQAPLHIQTPQGPAVLPSLTCELPIGVGYFMRELDDCMRAAVATALQVPYEQVPDLLGRDQRDQRDQFERLDAFGGELGLEVSDVVWPRGGAPSYCRNGRSEFVRDDELWVGMIHRGRSDESHAIVCMGRAAGFDPDGWIINGEHAPRTIPRIEVGHIFHNTEEAA